MNATSSTFSKALVAQLYHLSIIWMQRLVMKKIRHHRMARECLFFFDLFQL